jgi:alpha-glucosidase
MLCLYREALRLRRSTGALGAGTIAWRTDVTDGVLAFDREPGFTCVANLGPASVDLPPHTEVLLTSVPLEDGRLAPDATAWLRR